MKASFLKIEKPCDEKWENMSPNEKGSFCDRCSKTLIDLSALNHAEFNQEVKNLKRNACVRLDANQTNWPLIDLESETSFRFPYVNATAGLLLATALLGPQQLEAKAEIMPIELVQDLVLRADLKPVENKIKVSTEKPVETTIFKGKVTSEEGEAIENVRLLFVSLNKMITVFSQADGSFSMEIPTEHIDEDNVIRVKYNEIVKNRDKKGRIIHYHTKDLILTKSELQTNYQIVAPYAKSFIHGGGVSLPRFTNAKVIYKGKEVSYRSFVRSLKGKNSNLEGKSYYFFRSAAALAIYGKRSYDGLYVLYDDENK